jgi:hypothetical protein
VFLCGVLPIGARRRAFGCLHSWHDGPSMHGSALSAPLTGIEKPAAA